ncbi:MAG TPA: alpha/beta hydrolase [Abditibacteriaceae bacterium]|nr:alpha/beta hydrolase [Abditibacteriaceae bacterium]
MTQPTNPTAHDGPTESSLWLWAGQSPASQSEADFQPYLELFPLATDEPRGAVLICPGGGYASRAEHEGAVVARRFNEDGFHAFVAQYRVAPQRHPAPLFDVARAIRIIRHRAAQWKVEPSKIAVCGFSAGGHLAASLGVHFNEATPAAGSTPASTPGSTPDGLDALSCRPDALILCYPVISAVASAHAGSFHNLMGTDAPPDLRQKMSLELQVTPATPPAFLWHTFDDMAVPVENSLLFAHALRRQSIPFEMHIYPTGRHGLGLAEEDAHVATWMPLCCEWLRSMGW